MSFVVSPVGGGLVANEESEVRMNIAFGDAGVEERGLEAKGAQTVPLVLYHFLDENLLGGGGRVEFSGEVGEEGVEFLAIFAAKKEGGGVEAVRDAVEGGPGFAFGGLGSGGFLRIGAIGVGLGLSGHGKSSFECCIAPERRPGGNGKRAQASRSTSVIANELGKTCSGGWKLLRVGRIWVELGISIDLEGVDAIGCKETFSLGAR